VAGWAAREVYAYLRWLPMTKTKSVTVKYYKNKTNITRCRKNHTILTTVISNFKAIFEREAQLLYLLSICRTTTDDGRSTTKSKVIAACSVNQTETNFVSAIVLPFCCLHFCRISKRKCFFWKQNVLLRLRIRIYVFLGLSHLQRYFTLG